MLRDSDSSECSEPEVEKRGFKTAPEMLSTLHGDRQIEVLRVCLSWLCLSSELRVVLCPDQRGKQILPSLARQWARLNDTLQVLNLFELCLRGTAGGMCERMRASGTACLQKGC